MIDGVLAWAKSRRADWDSSLKGLRSRVLGTSEVRGGKRVDTTIETIAARKRELAELDVVIARREAGDPP
jgi:hypothetical protein